jgi:hypothetical protein
MVEALEPGRNWNGIHFRGSADVAFGATPGSYVFWRHSDGVQFTFDESEWWQVRDVVFYGWADPRLESILSELANVYGEL